MLRFHVLQESPLAIRVFFQRVPKTEVSSNELKNLTCAIQGAMGESPHVLWEETAHVPVPCEELGLGETHRDQL